MPDHPTPSEMAAPATSADASAATAGNSILDEMRRDPGFRRWFDAMTRYHRDVSAWLGTQGFGGTHVLSTHDEVIVLDDVGDIDLTLRLPLRLRLRSRWIAWRHGGRSLRSRLLAWCSQLAQSLGRR